MSTQKGLEDEEGEDSGGRMRSSSRECLRRALRLALLLRA